MNTTLLSALPTLNCTSSAGLYVPDFPSTIKKKKKTFDQIDEITAFFS